MLHCVQKLGIIQTNGAAKGTHIGHSELNGPVEKGTDSHNIIKARKPEWAIISTGRLAVDLPLCRTIRHITRGAHDLTPRNGLDGARGTWGSLLSPTH